MGGRVQDGELHSELFGEQTYHEQLEPLRAVRTDRYKLEYRHFPDGPRLVGNSRSAHLLEKHGWQRRPLGHVELFDLYLDPTEACNRAGDSADAAVQSDLEARLERWMTSTGDCFPTGEFPAPAGAAERGR